MDLQTQCRISDPFAMEAKIRTPCLFHLRWKPQPRLDAAIHSEWMRVPAQDMWIHLKWNPNRRLVRLIHSRWRAFSRLVTRSIPNGTPILLSSLHLLPQRLRPPVLHHVLHVTHPPHTQLQSPWPAEGALVSRLESPAPAEGALVSRLESPAPAEGAPVSCFEPPAPEKGALLSRAKSPARAAGAPVSRLES